MRKSFVLLLLVSLSFTTAYGADTYSGEAQVVEFNSAEEEVVVEEAGTSIVEEEVVVEDAGTSIDEEEVSVDLEDAGINLSLDNASTEEEEVAMEEGNNEELNGNLEGGVSVDEEFVELNSAADIEVNTLPQTGPMESLLVLVSLMLAGVFFIRNKRK